MITCKSLTFLSQTSKEAPSTGINGASLRHCQEVCRTLSGEEFLCSKRALFEGRVGKWEGAGEQAVRLEDGSLGTAAMNACKALFNMFQPISFQVPQGDRPALLVSNKHQSNHPQNCLFACHATQAGRNATILLPPEPRHTEVLVQLVDGAIPPLLQLGRVLFLWQLGYRIIEFLPQFCATRSNFVNRLAQLRADGQDASSVCAFPSTAASTWRDNNKILSRRAVWASLATWRGWQRRSLQTALLEAKTRSRPVTT